MNRGRHIRTRRQLVAAAAAGALTVGGLVVVNRDDDAGERQAAVPSSTTVFDRADADRIALASVLQPGDTPSVERAAKARRFRMDAELVADAPECANYLGVFDSPERDAGYADAFYLRGTQASLAQSVVIFPTEQAAIEMIEAIASPGFVACNGIWQQQAVPLGAGSVTPATGETFDVSAADQAAQLWIDNTFERQAEIFLRVGRGVSVLNPAGVVSGIEDEDVQALIPAAVDRLRAALGN